MYNYDHTAWFYDTLSRIVFGNAQVNAQLWCLRAIPPQASILIVGGGTGYILEEISAMHPSGLRITYIDASEKMMGRARKRNIKNNQVRYLTCPIQDADLDESFDVVFTPFLFDNFTVPVAQAVFACIDATLKSGGWWLYCDFQDIKLWHRMMLKAMYTFFKVMKSMDASNMPDMKRLFALGKYEVAQQHTFYGNFVISVVYKRAA